MGRAGRRRSIAAIHRAVSAGVNWIDTAPAYGFGRSERVVGQALRRLPAEDRPLVFTKCGLVWDGEAAGCATTCRRPRYAAECEASLRRLDVDVIDLLHAHWPTWDATPLEESWSAMAELVDEGKVRAIGLSNFTADDLARCEAIRHVDSYQPQLNLLARDVTEQALPWCVEHGTGAIVYSPMASGLLSGTFSAERADALPDDDWRRRSADFTEPLLTSHLAFVDALRPLAVRLGVGVGALAIVWTLAWPGVTGAIVGARSPAYVDDWLPAAQVALDDDTLDEIARAIENHRVGSGPARPPTTGA